MIVFGTRMFGQTDRVPGVFCVATQFFHVNFVPLCPLSTYLIIEARGLGPKGINIPMSTESLIAAWLRALAWIVAFVFSFVTIANVPSSNPRDYNYAPEADRQTAYERFAIYLVGSITLMGIAIFLQCHPKFKNASYERATEICTTLLPGGGRGLQRLVDQHFGRDVVVMVSDAMVTSTEEGTVDHDDDHMELAIASCAYVDDGDSRGPSDGRHPKNPHLRSPKRGHGSKSKLPTATVLEVMD